MLFFCHYFTLESSLDNPPAPWLQRGISRTLVADPDDRVRLNRKMLASLSKGTTLAADLFHLNDRELAKLLKGWSDHGNFERYEQFSAQSWSVFDYLAGTTRLRQSSPGFWHSKATDNRKRRTRTCSRIISDLDMTVFQSWREWVHKQGTGGFAPLPPQVQHKLKHQVIPLVANRQAKRKDRILAIRNIGIEGYVFGADALIELLHGDDAIPREEVIWALEAISGMAHGNDKERWSAWWSSLPIEIREGRHLNEENLTQCASQTTDMRSRSSAHVADNQSQMSPTWIPPTVWSPNSTAEGDLPGPAADPGLKSRLDTTLNQARSDAGSLERFSF